MSELDLVSPLSMALQNVDGLVSRPNKSHNIEKKAKLYPEAIQMLFIRQPEEGDDKFCKSEPTEYEKKC